MWLTIIIAKPNIDANNTTYEYPINYKKFIYFIISANWIQLDLNILLN